MNNRYVRAVSGNNIHEDYEKLFRDNRNSALKTLFLLYKGHYLELVGSVLFFVMKHSPVWILPIATANIIDAATNSDESTKYSILLNVFIMSIMVIQNIFTNYIHTWLYAKTIRNVEKDIRTALVGKLQHISIAYHRETESGRLQSKIIRDVEQVENLSAQIFITMLSILLNIVVAMSVVFTKDPIVFLFFGITIPVAVIIMALFRGRIKKYNKDFRQEMEETSVRVMEMVEMIPIARAHALEQEETNKMNSRLLQVAEKGLKLDMVQTYFSSISWVAFQLFQILCLGFTGYLAYRGTISVGDVVLYQTYFSSIVNNVSGVVSLIPIVARGLESVDSFGDILGIDDVEDNDEKRHVEKINGCIEFQNVSFGYPNQEKNALNNINLKINPGETVAFVGPSGSGKSTLLDLVIGFSKATEGRILIDGLDIVDINLNSYRKHIAVVPQTSILFAGTIRENITYGLEDVSEDVFEQVMKDSNLYEFVNSLPQKEETHIQEHGGNLSGGQRQRISIARAFIRDPQILILDEATSALDTVSERQIKEATGKLSKNRTTLIAAHRLSTIRDADKIIVISDGSIVESGTYNSLMEKQGFFYDMCVMQI